MKRYKQLTQIVRFAQPKTIIEIGAHRGERAEMLCREALKYRDAVHYTGYDLFECATPESNVIELNGKGPATEANLRERLSAIPGVTFELVKGNTRQTLHGTEIFADLAFIDGGHSVETIRGDFEAVKGSNVIVFDDYYTGGADISKFGCNSIVAGQPHELLPREDHAGGMGIKLAVIGYSSKWAAAFDRIREKDAGVKSVAIWRPGFNRRVDMVAAINSLEPLLEPGEVLEHIRGISKRIFFVIKADLLRALPWWRNELEKKFQVHEWFGAIDEIHGPETEVCGTASSLAMIGELRAKGVMAEDQRFEHTKVNCEKVKKRLPPPPQQLNAETAVIVCYGPSLQDTWTDLLGQIKFKGGHIFSVSGAHDYLLRRDVVPNYHVECDPRPHKADNLNRPSKGVEYLLASCCHPSLVEKLLPYDVTLWHMCNGEESFRTIDELEPDQFMIHGGGNAGLRAIAVAYVMGYRNFIIYGMDCSFKEDMQWAGAHVGKKKDVIEVFCDGEKFLTSSVMVSYARHFLSTIENAPGAQFTLVGHGLLQSMIKVANTQEKAA